MSQKNRNLKLSIAVGYLLAVSCSGLFHDHRGGHWECRGDGFHASHDSEGDSCPVCEFLAQKPAPIAEVASVGPGFLVQAVVPWRLPLAAAVVFAAWQSRAPPAVA